MMDFLLYEPETGRKRVKNMTMVRAGYPLYHQLKSLLLAKIESGEWPEGTMIPSEQELIVTHGVSRTTVRQAIQDLVSSGNLVRQQGRGTFVARPEHLLTSSPLYGFAEEWIQSGRRLDIPKLNVEVTSADAIVADRLRLDEGAPVLRISRVASEGGQPVFFDDSYLPESMRDFFQSGASEHPHIYSVLEAHGIVIAAGEQAIHADVASDLCAALLHCAIGAPILHIERLTRDGSGRPIEYSIARYRADSYQYRVRLTRTAVE